ncbi:sodium-dependent glucose transporter 1-like [Mercenaria mercenaria]|uniref:sodium-dependent glucose transporter 1-like n=1 Tax=Mercenaria mercenaria TaxID=6596 RepID=UPI00234F6AF5|nr:sodium-dependent glucose transporter 1-like [Mercenaria mercenaria]
MTKEMVQDKENQRSCFSKAVETGFLVLTWLALSTYVEIYGPTLIDLKIKLDTDYEQVAVAVSGRSVGWFPGSIVAGFLVDKFSGYSHLLIAIGLDIAAAVTVAIPWSPNVTCMWVLCFVGGFVESFLNIGGTRILFNIWREKSASFLMLIHLGYGIGSFVVPLYSNPFLADKVSQPSDGNTTLDNNTTTESAIAATTESNLSEKNDTLQKGDSRIEYAYAISALIVALVSIAFYFYQIRESRNMKKEFKDIKPDTKIKDKNDKRKKRSFKEMINPATCAKGRFWYGSSILFLLVFYFGNIAGGDRMIGNFIRSYAIDQLGFSKDSASVLNTAYWITFSAGRLIFIFLARCISIRILILVEAGGMALSSLLLMIFADESSLSLWIIIQFFSFFCAAIWPTGIAWTDYHIELTGLGMSLQTLGASVGGVCHMRLIGFLYEHYGPKTFLYQTLGYGALQFVLASCLDIVGAQHGNRFDPDDDNTVEIELAATENSTDTIKKS